MNSKILSQVPVDYYERGTKTNIFQIIWHGWKWKSLKPFIKGIRGNVLDIGCADGNLTIKIADFLPRTNIYGIDLYEKVINFAKSRNSRVNFLVADAAKLPFKNNFFDAVICVEALEHMPDIGNVLAEIKRVLKSDGKLIIAQDTDNWLFNFIWFFWTKTKGKVWEGAHINCMKPKQLEELMKINGFKIN